MHHIYQTIFENDFRILKFGWKFWQCCGIRLTPMVNNCNCKCTNMNEKLIDWSSLKWLNSHTISDPCWGEQLKKSTVPTSHFALKSPKKVGDCKLLCQIQKICTFAFFDHAKSICYLNVVEVKSKTIQVNPGPYTIYVKFCWLSECN